MPGWPARAAPGPCAVAPSSTTSAPRAGCTSAPVTVAPPPSRCSSPWPRSWPGQPAAAQPSRASADSAAGRGAGPPPRHRRRPAGARARTRDVVRRSRQRLPARLTRPIPIGSGPATRNEVTVTFDAHQLDTFLLLGSLVTLLAILAVRVSSRAGLPSLLIYLLMGVLLGEGAPRHRLRRRPDGARARVRRAGADPGRGWSHHQLGRDQTPDADGLLARHGRHRGQRRGDGRRRALPARAALGAGDPARRGLLADRRRGGVLGAARGAAAAPDHRRPRVRVRSQRRPHGRAGHAGLHRRGATTTACSR